MKTTHLAAAVGAAALAASAATAQDAKPRVERVIVLTDKDGHEVSSETGEGPRIRAFTLSDGAASCTGARDEVNEQSSGGAEKTHIILCSKGEGSDAERAAHLEKAISRIEQNQEISAEHKEKVIAALRQAIERLNTAH